MEKKIGLIENSNGERSHTKLISLIVVSCIMIGWVIVSAMDKEMAKIDPTLLSLIGICISGNGLNKWIEANGNADKARLIRQVIERVKKK